MRSRSCALEQQLESVQQEHLVLEDAFREGVEASRGPNDRALLAHLDRLGMAVGDMMDEWCLPEQSAAALITARTGHGRLVFGSLLSEAADITTIPLSGAGLPANAAPVLLRLPFVAGRWRGPESLWDGGARVPRSGRSRLSGQWVPAGGSCCLHPAEGNQRWPCQALSSECVMAAMRLQRRYLEGVHNP